MGDIQPTEVTNVFSKGEITVNITTRDWAVLAILLCQFRGSFVEFVSIFDRPPISQISVSVVLAPLVVETVAQLMADDRPNRAVVDRIICFQVKKGRLKDGGRKDDFVHERIVIGIDRLRRHMPFPTVNRLPEFVHHLLIFEFGVTHHVSEEIVRRNGQLAVVFPFVRVANFCGNF